MKTIKQAAVVAALVATPFVAFAQSNVPSNDSLTRAQVKQDLRTVERAGYDPSRADQASYPREAQAAEARVGVWQMRQAANGGYSDSSGYGGVMPGSSASGAPDEPALPAHTGDAPGTEPVYFGR